MEMQTAEIAGLLGLAAEAQTSAAAESFAPNA